jgi:xanthine dehydrogenase accessory factor
LAALPFAVRWFDSRREAFPSFAPGNITLIHALEPTAELRNAPNGALIVVMTHSHAIDLEIVAEALAAERFGFVGLIGSATKRARFLSQMRALGMSEAVLSRLVCPIGVPGVVGKDPAVIAASTAAQLLIVSESLRAEELAEKRGAARRCAAVGQSAANNLRGRTWAVVDRCARASKPDIFAGRGYSS